MTFFHRISLAGKIAAAAISLLVENCVTAFAWLLIWIAIFICIWLTGYSSRETTILFWAGSLVAYFLGLRKLQIPTKSEIIHRVEVSSHLKHRPLQGLNDRPATSSGQDFWDLEKTRQKKLITQLRYSKPDLNLSERDPYAFRIGFILIVLCAIFVTPHSWGQRLKNGLTLPQSENASVAEQPFAQLRITPPAYSGLKTLLINQSSGKKIDILPGSKLKVEVQTSWGHPVLKMGKTQLPMKRQDKTITWTAETIIPETDVIRVTTSSITRFKQSVNWIKDNPPIIGWNGNIEILPSGEMKLPLKIADDYGIQKLTLRAILAPDENIPLFGSALHIEKKMNLVIKDNAEITPVFDTTGHVWAGKKVSLLVEAEDFANNISETAPLEQTLPVRNFHNPLAAQLASIRTDLLNLRGSINDIVSSIEDILYRPDSYQWDNVMTLGLRSLDSRLHYDNSKESLESSASMLWSLAMRMEDGKISETQTSLREALDNLQQALQRDANKSEVAELMQQMQQALVQHLRTILQKAQKNLSDQMPPNLQMQYNMNLNALSSFLQKLQDDIASGDTNSAMKKLNELQQMTDMMGSSMAQGMPKEIQEMMENMSEVQDLIARQGKMLDRTRAKNPSDIPELTKEQKSILKKTEELSGKLPLKLQPVEDAKTEMSLSASSLEQKDMDASQIHQQKIMDLLKDANKSMQQQLQEKMQGMMGISMSGSGQVDPLGRPQGLHDSDTQIPGGASRKKTDQIIKTLREREGDMKRPLEERNYYQRLLKQW